MGGGRGGRAGGDLPPTDAGCCVPFRRFVKLWFAARRACPSAHVQIVAICPRVGDRRIFFEEMPPQGLLTATGFAARDAIAMLRKHNIATAPLLAPFRRHWSVGTRTCAGAGLDGRLPLRSEQVSADGAYFWRKKTEFWQALTGLSGSNDCYVFPDGPTTLLWPGDKLLEVKLNDQERRVVGRVLAKRKARLMETAEDTPSLTRCVAPDLRL